MLRITIRLLPQSGHYNGTFKLAEELKSAGHQVIYAGTDNFKQLVLANGFEFYTLDRADEINFFNSGKIRSNGEKFKLWIKSKSEILFQKKKIQRLIFRRNYFSCLVMDTRPDVVLLDSSLKIWGMQLLHYKIPFITVQTFVSTLSSKPSKDSFYVPVNAWYNTTIVWLTWKLYFLRRITYQSPKFYARNLAKKSGVDENELDFLTQGSFGYQSIPEINTSFLEFDFPHVKRDEHFYFNPPSLFNRIENCIDFSFVNEFHAIKASNRTTIYCSFGSLGWRYPKHKALIKKIANLFLHTFTDMNLILCIDDDLLRRHLRKNARENVYIYKWVPQIKILTSLADLMIAHGGMNSITECIFTETPMLIFPGSAAFDQIGNAARVKFHGIGLYGKPTNSIKEIALMILTLLNDNVFKVKLSKLKSKIQKNYKKGDVNVFVENYVLKSRSIHQ